MLLISLCYDSLQEESITKDVQFLVLASDGLWDVVSNQVCFGTLSLVWLEILMPLDLY